MQPKPRARDAFQLFQAHFDQLLNPEHELIQLAKKIDWPRFDAAFAGSYSKDMKAPAKAITNRGNWIVASLMLPDNPYDGHTLAATMITTESNTGVAIIRMCTWTRVIADMITRAPLRSRSPANPIKDARDPNGIGEDGVVP